MKLEVKYQGMSTLDRVLHELVGHTSCGGGYDFRTGVRDMEWTFADAALLQAAKSRIEADPRTTEVEIRIKD